MTVIENNGGASFTIYLPRTKENVARNEYPQVQVVSRDLPNYTFDALARLAKASHKRLAREQRKAEREYEG